MKRLAGRVYRTRPVAPVVLIIAVLFAMYIFSRPKELSPSHIVSIGKGWASNTVNTVIFRHHGLVSKDGYQFGAYYGPDGELWVVRREIKTDQVELHQIHGSFNTADAHNSISLGLDRLGFLHISYDQHGDTLRYRRSSKPLSIDAWGEELPMTGIREGQVTYPSFLMSGIGEEYGPLLFLYRLGVSGDGDACLKEYDEVGRCWVDRNPCILKGTGQKPWTSSPYWNHPAFDKYGRLHLSFVWRTHATGKDRIVNNINIDYALSPDLGKTWFTSRGRPLKLPITQVNSETVFAVSPGTNLINQASSAVDGNGRPHIAFYSDDPDGVPQYQHLWFDGKRWRHSYISERTEPFVLRGGGTLPIPISRPEVVIDDVDNVYIIFRGDLTGQRMAVKRLLAPDYQSNGEMRILWGDKVEFAEPVIDRIRWHSDRVLSILIQRTGQPAHDGEAPKRIEPIFIVDWDLVNGW